MDDLTRVIRGMPSWKVVGPGPLPAEVLKLDHPEFIVGDIVCSPRQVAAERTPIDAITGGRSNQDLIWYVKIGLYMDFNVYGGS